MLVAIPDIGRFQFTSVKNTACVDFMSQVLYKIGIKEEYLRTSLIKLTVSPGIQIIDKEIEIQGWN